MTPLLRTHPSVFQDVLLGGCVTGLVALSINYLTNGEYFRAIQCSTPAAVALFLRYNVHIREATRELDRTSRAALRELERLHQG